MFATQFGRMIWKEYRTQRILWASLLGGGLMWMIAINLSFTDQRLRIEFLALCPTLFSLLFTLGSGAMLFALEREHRTSDWLLVLAARPRVTFGAKLAFGIVATFGLQLSLILISLIIRGGLTVFDLYDHRWMAFNPVALLFLVWCVFGSLMSRRAIVAVGVSFAWFGITFMLPIIMLVSLYRHWQVSDAVIHTVMCLSLIGVLIGDLYLGPRWCKGEYFDGSLVEAFLRRIEEWIRANLRLSNKTSRLPRRVEYDQAWQRTWQRLVWQERHRESIHLALLIGGSAIGASCVISDSMSRSFNLSPIAVLICAAIPAAMGVLAFETDADQQQLRFLASRGISEISLWTAKLFVWMPRAFWITGTVFVCSFVLVRPFVATDRNIEYDQFLLSVWRFTTDHWGLVLWCVLISYCCGQLLSSIFRRTILAAVFTFLLHIIASYWISLFVQFPHAYWWGFGIPVALMLRLSHAQLTPRMYEDYTFRRYARLMVETVAVTVLVAVQSWLAHDLSEYGMPESSINKALFGEPNRQLNTQATEIRRQRRNLRPMWQR